MRPTTLAELVRQSDVAPDARGLKLLVPKSWIVEGEDRLSYTTILRLVECCREHHWQTDIKPWSGCITVDSICRTAMADFREAVHVGAKISITYKVIEVGTKSYALEFTVHDDVTRSVCAIVRIVSVFYDPVRRRSIVPPMSVREHLSGLIAGSGKLDTTLEN